MSCAQWATRASVAGRMVLCLVLVAAGSSCAGSRPNPFAAQEDARVRIEVENRTFEDATVHAIYEGRRLRLGRISGTMKSTYVLPVDRSVQVHFLIDLLAGPECATPQIWADPGDIIVLEIDSRTFGGPDCR